VQFSKRTLEHKEVNFEDFIAVKGIKALGNQLTTDKIKNVNLLEPLPYIEPEEKKTDDIEVIEEQILEDKLPLKISEADAKKTVTQELSAKEKAKLALEQSIAKKKAEQKKIDDENQTKLF